MENRLVCCLVVALWCAAAEGGEKDLGALVNDLGSPVAGTRSAARKALAESGAGALDELALGLGSKNLTRSAACAVLIGETGNAVGRKWLRAVLEEDGRSALVVRACCRSLGRIGDHRDVALLASHLSRFPEAAEALAEIGERSAVAELTRLAEEDAAHPAIFFALASLGEEEGFRRLIDEVASGRGAEALRYLRAVSGIDAGEAAEDWEEWWRREQLARGLGSPDWDRCEEALAEALGPKSSGGELSGVRLGDLLAIAGDVGRGRDCRTKAVLALGLARDRRAAPTLLELLNGDEDGMVRLYAAEALGRIGLAGSAVDLCGYLVFDEEPFRKLSGKGGGVEYFTIDSEVCKSLVKLGVVGGLDYMIRQLGQEHRVRVYHEAVATLRKVTGENHGFRPDAPKSMRREAAARWRGWFDAHRGEITLEGRAARGDRVLGERIATLVNALDHFHFLSMSRARETLVLLGEVALDELLAGLTREEVLIRAHCAEILGRIRSKAARKALARAVGDVRPEVRVEAVTALGEIGPGPEWAAVVGALEDPSLDVRIGAARAAARVEGSVSLPAIEAALEREENQSDTFRREAFYAVAAHGEALAVERLLSLLERPDQAFRQAVADRVLELTGRSPGLEEKELAEWWAWWRVSRERYRPLERGDTGR